MHKLPEINMKTPIDCKDLTSDPDPAFFQIPFQKCLLPQIPGAWTTASKGLPYLSLKEKTAVELIIHHVFWMCRHATQGKTVFIGNNSQIIK